MMTQRLPETQKIIDYLSRVPYGESVSFQDIAQHCSIDLKTHRHLLNSSIKTLANEGVYFRSIRGVGYCRLHPDSGVDNVRKWHNGQQSRSTHKMSRQLNGANLGHLSPHGKKSLEAGLNEVWFRKEVENKLLKEQKQKAIQDKVQEQRLELQASVESQQDSFFQKKTQEEREKEEKRRAAKEKAEQEKRDRQALLDKQHQEFLEKLKQQPKTE